MELFKNPLIYKGIRGLFFPNNTNSIKHHGGAGAYARPPVLIGTGQ